ncbi:histone-fold-containing protein [Polyplosphaeria fusca]|uniref:NCT transcriptional regulatory complex subunit A n=1 Tax=Polyplosphaeria fusca TaxID=682080 RepID=A0A9P4QPV0_9PLEO|nr:histone-fold-containing protein [Polyplosphaeria fusca]
MPRAPKDEDADFMPDAPELPKGKARAENGATTLAGTEHIEVKTKFPVARIKRIMQADDDVGKVAQVTPVVVSKALELFMISIVTKAATEAKARNSKRVSTMHLKEAVTKDEQFDFLSDIVSKVADAPAAADKGDGDAMEVDGKKKKSAGRRKKKTDDDDY